MDTLPNEILELIITNNCPRLILVARKFYPLVKKHLGWLCQKYSILYPSFEYYFANHCIKNLYDEKPYKYDIEKDFKISLKLYSGSNYPYVRSITCVIISNSYLSIIIPNKESGYNDKNYELNFNFNLLDVKNKSYLDQLKRINMIELLSQCCINVLGLIEYVRYDGELDWNIFNYITPDLANLLQLIIPN